MNTAVVKLYALAYAVGSCREDDDTRTGSLLELGGVSPLVGQVMVVGARGELSRAGVDGLHERSYPKDLAKGTHRVLALPRELCDLHV